MKIRTSLSALSQMIKAAKHFAAKKGDSRQTMQHIHIKAGEKMVIYEALDGYKMIQHHLKAEVEESGELLLPVSVPLYYLKAAMNQRHVDLYEPFVEVSGGMEKGVLEIPSINISVGFSSGGSEYFDTSNIIKKIPGLKYTRIGLDAALLKTALTGIAEVSDRSRPYIFLDVPNNSVQPVIITSTDAESCLKALVLPVRVDCRQGD